MFTIEYFESIDGTTPYFDWLDSLADPKIATRVSARIDRVEAGNFGDHKPLGMGVWELRIDFGPGYRVYYGRVGTTVVLLLAGGRKSTQRRDILKARRYLREQEGRSS